MLCYAFARRKSAAWSGGFERHQNLELEMTGVGTQWIIECLRVLELYDFDANVAEAAAEKIGPELSDIVGGD